jgi:MFS family permease
MHTDAAPSAAVSSRWLLWLFAAFAVTHAATNIVRPMVSYRALQMGVPPEGLGLLAASFSLAPLVIALSIGRLVDRRGEMTFVIGGTVVMAVCSFAIALAPSIVVLTIFYALVGLGHLVMVVATQSLVARGSASSGYDRAFGHLSFAASLGQLAGPAIGGLIAGQGSPDETTRALVVAGVLGVLGLPLVLAIRPPRVEQSTRREAADASRPPLLSILRTPGVARAILVSMTVLSAIDIVVVYLPALGEERGWAASLVGGLLAARAAASMASRIFLGRLSDRFGRRLLLIVSMSLAAASLVALPFAPSAEATLVIMIAAGLGLGIGQPLTMSWVAAEATPGTRATALSVRLMGNRVGQVALPVIAGSVAAFAGAGGVLAVTGIIVGISLAAVAGGLGPRGRPPAGPDAGVDPGRG